ncbi:MAG: alpha/beta hydrolase fold domain-containing protein [Proteobacteria bacterium]|nr:alpha/beta hydrolase fold domain-containing protein [Pseudomonadota bacterium]
MIAQAPTARQSWPAVGAAAVVRYTLASMEQRAPPTATIAVRAPRRWRGRARRQRPSLLLTLAVVTASCVGAASEGERHPPARAPGGEGAADQPGEGVASPLLLGGGESSPAVPRAKRPLLLLLHGYGAGPESVVEGLGLARLLSRQRLLALVPAGRLDRHGQRFWRAGPACCDFFSTGAANADDAPRLQALLEQTWRAQRADARRLYVVGHSNGGHLAYRLACAGGGRLAAVVSLAGADFSKGPCPSPPRLSVLHVQGDRDPIVPYRPACVPRPGPRNSLCYPGAEASTRRWALRLGCAARRVAEAPLRVGAALSVSREHYADCPPGLDVALWTVRGGGHTTATFAPLLDAIWAWLNAHPRPPP